MRNFFVGNIKLGVAFKKSFEGGTRNFKPFEEVPKPGTFPSPTLENPNLTGKNRLGPLKTPFHEKLAPKPLVRGLESQGNHWKFPRSKESKKTVSRLVEEKPVDYDDID